MEYRTQFLDNEGYVGGSGWSINVRLSQGQVLYTSKSIE